MIVFSIVIFLFILLCMAGWMILKSRNMQIWVVDYLFQALKSRGKCKKKNIYFCLVDHYEPYFNQVDDGTAKSLVDRWMKEYRELASQHFDSSGNRPKHSYFYPIEEYNEYILEQLKSICSEGLGDLDIHLHHDDDTAENLENTLNEFNQMLFDKHDLLRKNSQGKIVYGFIHGNWALANSRPDGRWCGVDNEIEILLKTGCVFDMTMPSAPSDTQTSTVNSIYFAEEKGVAKSHDVGIKVSKGKWLQEKLLMVQGPIKFNWKRRKFGLIPKIETGELSFDAPPSEERIDLWEGANVTIENSPENIFIKLHTHGLQPKNMTMFFDNGGFENLWSLLETKYRDQPGYTLHYVSAWEMYQKIKQLTINC